ncbi:universal stress protein [Haloferax sp. DFSO60]|uniref:universal stress protein n=1 Tax=Haloferax sp. DFSO60 TaxID=3388652 RepID=UPI0039792C24
MRILVPVDGTEASGRALAFAIDMAVEMEATLHVVHFTDRETDATETILDDAQAKLDAADIPDQPELTTITVAIWTADRVGKEILDLVETRDYDHVVMGHHEDGAIERAVFGSAAETVLRAEVVPVTIVP